MREHIIELPHEVFPQSVAGYVRLFQLENWLRELVYLETKAHFGDSWWTECDAALVRSIVHGIPAEKSLSRDKLHPHMATPEHDPLWFLSFDSLLKIIFDEKLWPLFACYLTTKELLKQKFSEIGPIRNRCGHNRRCMRTIWTGYVGCSAISIKVSGAFVRRLTISGLSLRN